MCNEDSLISLRVPPAMWLFRMCSHVTYSHTTLAWRIHPWLRIHMWLQWLLDIFESASRNVTLSYVFTCDVFTCDSAFTYNSSDCFNMSESASRNVTPSSDSFHRNCYTPKTHQIEKLTFLGISQYKWRFWFEFVPRNLSFWICWISGLYHFQWNLTYVRNIGLFHMRESASRNGSMRQLAFYMRVTWLIPFCAKWLIDMCDVTHPYL